MKLLAALLLLSTCVFGQYPVPTVALTNIPESRLIVLNNEILMFRYYGKALYKTDGTNPATLVKQFNASPQYSSSVLYDWVQNQGIIYFKIYEVPTSVAPPLHELWRTDGTDTGTYIIKSSNSYWNASSIATLFNTTFFIGPDSIYAILGNNQLVGLISDYTFPNTTASNLNTYKQYLLYNSSVNQRVNAWDSQTNTFTPLMPIPSPSSGFTDEHFHSLEYHDTLYTFHPNINYLYWLAPDLNYQVIDTAFHPYIYLGTSNNKMLFAANLSTDTLSTSLYSFDLTSKSIQLIQSNQLLSVNPKGSILSNDTITFFGGDDGIHGTELWQTDGSSANTIMANDFSPGTASSRITYNSGYLCDNFLYLQMLPYTGSNGFHVWDGSTLSTSPLFNPSEEPYEFVNINTEVYFNLRYFSGTVTSLYKFNCSTINSLGEQSSSQFEIYPNPATNSFTIHGSEKNLIGKMRIINAIGICMKELTLQGTSSANQIDISNLSTGIYLIEFTDGINGTKSNLRLVKN